MQCNQAFCGNGFPNGLFCSSYSTPLQSNQSMYPEIVGEGQVTSITLSDGSVQFFFMPTIKWQSPNTTQCYPFGAAPNPMFANMNYSIPPQCNNNAGSWFIRSFLPCPQSVSCPPRNEFSKQSNTNSCHNLNNCLDYRYQLKFHNEACSSTTDLVYFYPNLRKCDFVYTLPCKDKTVQIDTRCRNERVCCKPCNCAGSPQAAPMSLECLVDSKNNKIRGNDSCLRSKDKNKACDSRVPCIDKSITTYADESSDCTPAGGRETQTIRSCCDAETRPMNKALLKPKWTAKSCSEDSMSVECFCDDFSNTLTKDTRIISEKNSKCKSSRSTSVKYSCKDISKKPECNANPKPINKVLLEPKWTAKSYSGDSMTDECSCDDHSEIPNKRVTKRRKPKKCDCGCESCNRIRGKSDGRGTYSSTCTSNCCTSVLNFKFSPYDIVQKPSREPKTSLQQVLDNVCLDFDMREPLCPSSGKALEGESTEHLLDISCLDCDTVATTCDRFKYE